MTPHIEVLRITDETVACFATVSLFQDPRFSVALDGAKQSTGFATSVVRSDDAQHLMCAFGRAPSPGSWLAFVTSDGEVLAELDVPAGESIPELDLDQVLARINSVSDRVSFLRQFCDTGSSILKLSGVPGFQEIRGKAIERAVELSATCVVEQSVDLGEGIVLWVLRGTPTSSTEAVQFQSKDEVRSSPFKPLEVAPPKLGSGTAASEATRSILLTDSGRKGMAARRLLLWGRRALWSADVSGVRIGPKSGFLPLIQGLGDDAQRLVSYLAANLAPYLSARPQLKALVNEAAVMAPAREARPLVSDRPIGFGVDLAVVTAEGQLFASGWVVDPTGLIEELSWIHPAGVRMAMTGRWVRIAAPRLPDRYAAMEQRSEAFGFAVTLDGAGPAAWVRQQRFEVRLKSGATLEIVAPPSPRTPAAARDAVLRIVTDEELSDDLIRKAVAPAVASLQRAHLAGERISREIVIGEMPERPKISMIIPVYKALEFLRYQMAAFSTDPGFAGVELVLVLDSPEQVAEVEMRMRALHGLYGVPLRIVVHPRNLGYAPAINTGVSRSHGDVLVLMNSDVVPAAPGWLSVLRKRLGKDVGAVGPKLLFHDDSIQHAGMSFDRDLRELFFNRHDYKGYPRAFPAASVARQTPALTGACLMLTREVFDEVGGLSEDYVVGDFEDSDFSLRIAATSRSLWYEAAAELYHYERQSIAQNESYTMTCACGYNRWLHVQRWGQTLERLVNEAGGAAASRRESADGGRRVRR